MRTLRALPEATHAEPLEAVVARRPLAYTFAELVALSTERKAKTAIKHGTIKRLLHDCYVAAEHAESFAARVDAAMTWSGPKAVVAGAAALHLWGILREPPPRLMIAIPANAHVRAPAWICPRHVSYEFMVGHVGPYRVAAPEVALAHGFAELPLATRSETVYRAVRNGMLDLDILNDVLRSLPRIKHRRPLQRILHAAMSGAQSYLEQVALTDVFNTVEFSTFIRQHRFSGPRRTYLLDMYDPVTRTAVELDGGEFHSSHADRARDVERDAVLASVGVLTVRLTYDDIINRPDWCRATVRAVLASRRSGLSRP